MTTSRPSSPSGPATPTRVNLSEVVNNYLQELQRVFDVMNYALAADRHLSEQKFDAFSRGQQVMPFPHSRLDYEGARAETKTWLLKQTLNEAIAILVLFLDDCRTLATLSSWKAKSGDGSDLQKKLQEDRFVFARLDLPGKLAHLETNFELSSPSKEHILSLFKLRRALANHGGIVTENDTINGKLTLLLRSGAQTKTTPASNRQPNVFVASDIRDIVREFEVGDKIRLHKQDQLATLLTVAFFITSLAQSLKEFARKSALPKT